MLMDVPRGLADVGLVAMVTVTMCYLYGQIIEFYTPVRGRSCVCM